MEFIDELLSEELSTFLIQAHLDLFECEEIENYEQCSLIKCAVQMYLSNAAQNFVYRTGHRLSTVLNLLNQLNDDIHAQLRGEDPAEIIFEVQKD